MEDAAYQLASHGLFTLFSYRTQDHQSRVIAPTMGRAHPHEPLIKEISYRLAYNLILGVIFSDEVPSSQPTLIWVKLTKPFSRVGQGPCTLYKSKLTPMSGYRAGGMVNPSSPRGGHVT